MTPIINRSTALLLAGLAFSGHLLAEETGAPVAEPAPASMIDPAAIQSLERMGEYLRGLTAFSLRADDTVDEVLDSGQKIQLTKTVEIQARKPDRLRASVETDRKAREFFYDGKHFTLLTPETGYYATVPAPSSIRELVDEIEVKYDIEFPLVDLFRWGENPEATAEIQEAMRVGTSRIGGQLADHYAFRQDGIDWQIWIAQGPVPLPLRYVIVTTDEPGEPQYMANLTWDTQARPDDAIFVFTPGKDDRPIDIVQNSAPATPEESPK
ncbi:DUF2092 domain-containing protein [Thiobaca trueperi]|uniref:DUF2092 domain-containing protein n=1 Tax=Thiobaca trueperi TaxID=127458 RepID=A0A4R3N7I8_9GAMM|nr:DUF2092 domain-containing protein [Thiobaca trueperi]TCT23063.1 hypothetical protein EDC35_102400 [Thiobaca trueperi]